MILDLILLICLLLFAIWTVMTVRLLRSVIGLALTSAILSIIMFRLNSPLAAVFELSVCSGLMSVIFVSTVSFTRRVSKERLPARRKERFVKFWYLPFIILIFGAVLLQYEPIIVKIPQITQEQDVRNILWNSRHLDLLGQIIILICGVFGVVLLFKEIKKDDN